MAPAKNAASCPKPRGHVFVYGTLRRGGRNEVYRVAPVLEAIVDEIEPIVPGADSEYFKRQVDGDRIVFHSP